MLAFLHTNGTVCTAVDPEGYGAPDWLPLPDLPEGDGPWEWSGTSWLRNAGPAWAALRAEGVGRLCACAWSQLADVPEVTRDAWQPYRQALRDMTETADPFAPVWPAPPE